MWEGYEGGELGLMAKIKQRGMEDLQMLQYMLVNSAVPGTDSISLPLPFKACSPSILSPVYP